METLACTNCGANLPQGSQFCLKCGQALPATETSSAIEVPPTVVVSSRSLPRETVRPRLQRRQRPRIFLWLLVLMLPLGMWWATSSDMPAAQHVRSLFTTSETEAIIPANLSVSSHSFSAYKFTVPASASNVVVSGQFKATGGSTNDVEVVVLADAAFATWQSGYSTNTYYSSGRVSQGDINAALPQGAGTYYVVFSNKFSPRTAKVVQADVNLRYDRWLPDWALKLKEQFWTPLGFAVVPPPSG
jgi:hypothetical protein